MTSPVDTSVKLFWSGMANVPVLSGQAGALLGVLDACLVTGCDIKPLTSLVVADGIATASFSGQHSALVDSVILVEGVTGALADLNGEQKVTARPNANTLTFATSLPDGVAAGAVTIRMAPAGWRKPFAEGNKAAYTSADPHSLGMWLRVDDSTRNPRVRGFESMSGLDTGTGPFPTDSMASGGGYWNKSSKTDASAVPWVLAADGRMMMLWMAAVVPSNANANGGCVYAFGDVISRRPGGDAYAAILSCDVSTDRQLGGLDYFNQAYTAVPRGYSALGSSVWHSSYTYTGRNSGNASGNDATLGAFPNVVTGELFFSRTYLAAGSSQPPRGDLPGFYSVPQSGLKDYFQTGNVVPATGHLQGRNLFALRLANDWGYSPVAVAFIDQTGPWR